MFNLFIQKLNETYKVYSPRRILNDEGGWAMIALAAAGVAITAYGAYQSYKQGKDAKAAMERPTLDPAARDKFMKQMNKLEPYLDETMTLKFRGAKIPVPTPRARQAERSVSSLRSALSGTPYQVGGPYPEPWASRMAPAIMEALKTGGSAIEAYQQTKEAQQPDGSTGTTGNAWYDMYGYEATA